MTSNQNAFIDQILRGTLPEGVPVGMIGGIPAAVTNSDAFVGAGTGDSDAIAGSGSITQLLVRNFSVVTFAAGAPVCLLPSSNPLSAPPIFSFRCADDVSANLGPALICAYALEPVRPGSTLVRCFLVPPHTTDIADFSQNPNIVPANGSVVTVSKLINTNGVTSLLNGTPVAGEAFAILGSAYTLISGATAVTVTSLLSNAINYLRQNSNVTGQSTPVTGAALIFQGEDFVVNRTSGGDFRATTTYYRLPAAAYRPIRAVVSNATPSVLIPLPAASQKHVLARFFDNTSPFFAFNGDSVAQTLSYFSGADLQFRGDNTASQAQSASAALSNLRYSLAPSAAGPFQASVPAPVTTAPFFITGQYKVVAF